MQQERFSDKSNLARHVSGENFTRLQEH